MTGPEFRAIRLALGLSQVAMGEAVALTGAHVGTRVSQWERGTRPIPAYVARIAELMAITPPAPQAHQPTGSP